ncbi:CgeB family protein [Crateriforma spongiae]|uniref:CgeB family protein n=1 Tax=Crateriforma spongiae TaxID=2724528 RepID=UPI0014489124|nr:glycosyltransferase [Crateriforma spongiae]
MKVVYVGNSSPSSTSYHRACALERLGHDVVIVDMDKIALHGIGSAITSRVHYRTGYRFVQKRVQRWLKSFSEQQPDLVWVNSGELLGRECVKVLRQWGCPVVLYNNDDPTGGRDGRRFDSLLAAIPDYDLCVVCRDENVSEYGALGAKKILRVYMSYDEVQHAPPPADGSVAFQSDVAFIGTWMRNEGRDRFLCSLMDSGFSVAIWGNSWSKSPVFHRLSCAFRGSALYGSDYVSAIRGAKVCLGMLSKGNRDFHTRRSVEIPFAGGLLCAERTSEHTEMFREGEEAMFWSDAEECKRVCKTLLCDDAKREKIRDAGMRRVRELKVGNEDICSQILNAVF